MVKKLFSSFATLTCFVLLISSCVPKRQLLFAEQTVDKLRSDSTQFANRISSLENNLKDLESRRSTLQQQLEATRKEATSRLQDASSRLNMSQEQIADQQRRLEQLQSLIDQQKKNTELLRSKITDALVGFNSNELTVSTKNGKVYVSLQENLL